MEPLNIMYEEEKNLTKVVTASTDKSKLWQQMKAWKAVFKNFFLFAA